MCKFASKVDLLGFTGLQTRTLSMLYDLAQHIVADAIIPDCVKIPISNLLSLITQTVVAERPQR